MTIYHVKVTHAYIHKDGKEEFYSASLDSKFALQYHPNIWTVPLLLPGSKLFVFPNLKTTFQYLQSLATPYIPIGKLPFEGKVLWWCETKGIEVPVYLPPLEPSEERLRLYWDTYPNNPDFNANRRKDYVNINGTLFADAVKLVKKVTTKEIERILGYSWKEQKDLEGYIA